MFDARWLLTLAVVWVLLVGAVGPAAAHETVTIDGYELTFGGSDEPVMTGERMWLQVEVVDASTGEPVEGQGESLEMAVQRPFGNDTFELAVGGVHGQPGLYEGAVVFTEPGTYTVYVNGSIDGTEIDTSFQKQVHDATALEYPERSRTGASSSGFDLPLGFGLGVASTAVVMTAAFFVGRRL